MSHPECEQCVFRARGKRRDVGFEIFEWKLKPKERRNAVKTKELPLSGLDARTRLCFLCTVAYQGDILARVKVKSKE